MAPDAPQGPSGDEGHIPRMAVSGDNYVDMSPIGDGVVRERRRRDPRGSRPPLCDQETPGGRNDRACVAADVVCRVREPTPLGMVTIRGAGERRGSAGIASVTRMTPITLVSTTVRSVSGSTVVGSCRTPPVIPALSTSTSRAPAVSSTSRAASVTLARPGPQARDHAQLLQLIALGRACWSAPESCRTQLREDVAAVPVLDAPTVTTVIAWPPHIRSRGVAALVRTAVRVSA